MSQPSNIDDWNAGKYIANHIATLRERPVAGVFDETHLRRIHERIFHGFTELYDGEPFQPGQYRPSLEGIPGDWCKDRPIVTQDSVSVVSYSRMDAAAIHMLRETLERADPERLSKLDTISFTKEISSIYTWLDYIHPFPEGNSRTLREFTRQLANESGYEINWEIFNANQEKRDDLYVARDVAVNRIAVAKGIYRTEDLQDVRKTLASFWQHPKLSDLLRDAIKPLTPPSPQNVATATEERALGHKQETGKTTPSVAVIGYRDVAPNAAFKDVTAFVAQRALEYAGAEQMSRVAAAKIVEHKAPYLIEMDRMLQEETERIRTEDAAPAPSQEARNEKQKPEEGYGNALG